MFGTPLILILGLIHLLMALSYFVASIFQLIEVARAHQDTRLTLCIAKMIVIPFSMFISGVLMIANMDHGIDEAINHALLTTVILFLMLTDTNGTLLIRKLFPGKMKKHS